MGTTTRPVHTLHAFVVRSKEKGTFLSVPPDVEGYVWSRKKATFFATMKAAQKVMPTGGSCEIVPVIAEVIG